MSPLLQEYPKAFEIVKLAQNIYTTKHRNIIKIYIYIYTHIYIYVYICLMRLNVLSGAMCLRKTGQKSNIKALPYIYQRALDNYQKALIWKSVAN